MGNPSGSKRKISPIPCSLPSASRLKTGPELFARDSEDDLKLAVDFGATFTIVAVCKPKETGSRERPEFHVLRNYAFDPTPFPGDSEKGVPSESYYPPNSIAQNRHTKTNGSLEVVSDHLTDLPTLISQTIRPGYLWGNEIDKELRAAGTARYEQMSRDRIQGMKLILDRRNVTKKWRHKTRKAIGTLQTHNDKIFKQELDVICDFLTAVLIHARLELERDYSLHAGSQVEYIYTIPPSFEGRSMETAFMEALKRSGLPVAPATRRHKTFVVNEAEASASYVIYDQQIQCGETFIIMDLGGGTGDVGTYTADRRSPLRIGCVVIHPDGDLCGSYNVNNAWRALWRERLKDLNLESENKSLDTLIEIHLMQHFEDVIKKGATLRPGQPEDYLFFPGIKEDLNTHYLRDEKIRFTREDLVELFEPELVKIERLLLDQLEHSQIARYEVHKVVVVGGFSQSPAVQDRITKVIHEFNKNKLNDLGEIRIIWPHTASGSRILTPAVAIGALIRSLDKNYGPKRYLRKSFAILLHIPFDNGKHPMSPILKVEDLIRCRDDGLMYWYNRLQWFVRKVDMGAEQRTQDVAELGNTYPYMFLSRHTFARDDFVWKCGESIYESDKNLENYIDHDSAIGQGAQNIGTIEWEPTELKWQGLIELTTTYPPEAVNPRPYYDVTFRIGVNIIDRDIKFEAIWPANREDYPSYKGPDKKFVVEWFPIATAFDPGHVGRDTF